MLFPGNMPLRFKSLEFNCFNWIYSAAPCFPVNASKVNIINDPKNFYDTLCERFQKANQRISVASLYLGTGHMEKKLLEITKRNLNDNKCLNFKVLLDYQRGTRGEVNSVTLLRDFVNDAPKQCSVSLYQTPRLHGSWSKALPSRYNELVGLQHMKLYIADDSVMLSGANYSNDYFQQRQDRYIEIQDAELANFYSELIDEVSNFSKHCTKNGIIERRYSSREIFNKEMKTKIDAFMARWQERQLSKLSTSENSDAKDTWIFPLIQMGEFGITQDEQVTTKILASVPEGSIIRLATGYFNLTDEYAKTLLKDCKANISLLMAHPNANGFLGASGPAGGIPHAYSLIARKFWQRVVNYRQINRVEMLEYERPGWTFHAKGLWYYPPGCGVPWATIVGSANLGERSVRRDLEAQAAIFTVSPELQLKLHQESEQLHQYASECSGELQNRETPLWVRATVGLFRTYF
ncbi:CDP-diacylglycerol--glycerol-3-phosphate 3-phosphatidyltransferase, mitochondrial [Helicoverpa zea]|uniref:CDP-diacylglycerol--glycerol-3-phosphate 3-phosphatidyltransferase, mitochondrial n=1 Tax=Helicoverpa zea TaxID=7113 RepID=UPI001F58A442|nr:CDP-diacylglycerol--glycerol-3-phosphate 3-phosphatidyltransferase, mitochondrial [Helicoverpa zea]